jgi:DNA-binding transcriptional LysR family regulator
LRVNNGELARDAAVAGLGITQLPEFITGADLHAGKLVRVLDDFRPPPISIYAVYPQHRQSSLLIRAFTAFLKERFDGTAKVSFFARSGG